MKLKFNKKNLVTLSKDSKVMPNNLTVNIAGGAMWMTGVRCYEPGSTGCISNDPIGDTNCRTNTCA
ncbi:hypothetical protein CWB96_06060 [Pseudoalteromonas citrea]|uniref:Uncharacterized protein n=1 Tax=Pseudoalteromonas citrea TaxID=43655 RepID=A0A5S3XTY9_9GAMM|nr:hypothetical protein [Pseudoalteromonas citrea]TMP44350.1 hypothetical protein CWB97_06605 [Pseudoalteromonas citrea]TMP60755.1 hypothetical protein CWB96_06060 [Pseudoalteromonas citrea]